MRRGAETAIDLVSENSDRYGLVREVLPFVDHLIVNEVEAGRIERNPARGILTIRRAIGYTIPNLLQHIRRVADVMQAEQTKDCDKCW